MAKIVVLGAGRVGRVIARDLGDEPGLEVTVADLQEETAHRAALPHGLTPRVADLSNPAAVRTLAGGFDLVVGALPGALGLRALEAVVDAGRPVVDISFMPEDPRSLDGRARECGAVVVYDMGVAPGMSNILLAQSVRHLAPATSARYLVGGLPVVRRWPWEYEAPFSPADVIEEYTRPARIRAGGQIQVRPPLSDVEHFDFPGIGTLEGFLTDGLRSLLDTLECPDVHEKTLRYPGHADRIRMLADSGFLDEHEIDVQSARVSPRDVTAALLEAAWRQDEGAREFTVMRVEVEGRTGDHRLAPVRRMWSLLDSTDEVRGETSMARTTGFPAAIVARRLLDGTAPVGPGVHPPEALAADDAFVDQLLGDLATRGVAYTSMEHPA